MILLLITSHYMHNTYWWLVCLLCSQFGFEWCWHFWWWWTWNGQTDFNTVVDEPLQSSQCTDHNNTWHQTVPHTHETKFLGNFKGWRSLGLVQFRYNDISWMRYNGTEHTSNITGSECNDQLFTLGAFSTWFWNDVPRLKRRKISDFLISLEILACKVYFIVEQIKTLN